MPEPPEPVLLIYRPTLDRLGDRIRDAAPAVRMLTMGDDGTFELDGHAIPAPDIAPHLAWMNIDLYVSPNREAFFQSLLDSPTLAWVQTAAAGLDSPLFGQLIEKGVRLCNSDAQAPSMADFVVGNVMAYLQGYERRLAAQAEKQWQFLPFRELGRTHWLIIGYGNIGRETARRLKGFGTKVTGIRRTPVQDEFADRIDTLAALGEHLPHADVVLLACSLNDQTRGLVDAAFLAGMKQGGILVNVGRGGLVDEPALIDALDGDNLQHVVLDVFETEPLPSTSPLWSHPKALVTSHTSGFGDGLEERGDALFLDNLARYLAGDPLRNEVSISATTTAGLETGRP